MLNSIGRLFSDLSSVAWAAAVFLLVFGLFKLISAQSMPQMFAQPAYPAYAQNVPATPIAEDATASGIAQPESVPAEPDNPTTADTE